MFRDADRSRPQIFQRNLRAVPDFFTPSCPIWAWYAVALCLALPASAQRKVVLEDGSPPANPVSIERVCAFFSLPEALTDHNGHFELRRESKEMVTGADNDGENAQPVDLQNCELKAVASGFHPAPVGPHREFILHSSGQAIAPGRDKKQRELLTRARRAMRANDFLRAKTLLDELVALDPTDALPWYDLGRVHDWRQNRAEAERCYRRAIAADPNFEIAYLHLANLLAIEQHWPELNEAAVQWIRLNSSDYPAAFYYAAVAQYHLGDLDQAGRAARQGLKIDARHTVPVLHRILGTILADDRHFADAATEMKLYLKEAPDAEDRGTIQKLAGDWARSRP